MTPSRAVHLPFAILDFLRLSQILCISVSAARDAANKVMSMELPFSRRTGSVANGCATSQSSRLALLVLVTSAACFALKCSSLRSPRLSQAERKAAKNRGKMSTTLRLMSGDLTRNCNVIHLSNIRNGICRNVYPPTTAPQKKGNPWIFRERCKSE